MFTLPFRSSINIGNGLTAFGNPNQFTAAGFDQSPQAVMGAQTNQLLNYGFDAVRLMIEAACGFWLYPASGAGSAKDPEMDWLKFAVRRLMRGGMKVILDGFHPSDGTESLGMKWRTIDPLNAPLLYAYWEYVTDLFLGFGPGLMFEVQNEPLDVAKARLGQAPDPTLVDNRFNTVFPTLLSKIRAIDPTRTLIFPAMQASTVNDLANTSINAALLADKYLAVSVHNNSNVAPAVLVAGVQAFQQSKGLPVVVTEFSGVAATLNLGAAWTEEKFLRANRKAFNKAGIPASVHELGTGIARVVPGSMSLWEFPALLMAAT